MPTRLTHDVGESLGRERGPRCGPAPVGRPTCASRDKGDQRAFAAIYRRYHQDLYRYCLAIVGNPEDAQDALQNTMVKVLRAASGREAARSS